MVKDINFIVEDKNMAGLEDIFVVQDDIVSTIELQIEHSMLGRNREVPKDLVMVQDHLQV